MRIQKLRLTNYRCFEDLAIEFDRSHNLFVFVADNMAGKSAIFQGMKVGLQPFVTAISRLNLTISPQDHRITGENPFSDSTLDCRVEVTVDFWEHNYSLDGEVVWARERTTLYGNTSGPKVGDPVKKIAKGLYRRVSESGIGHLPLIQFVGTEYISVAASESSSFASDLQIQLGYNASLSGKSIEQYMLNWFRRMQSRVEDAQRSAVALASFGEFPSQALAFFKQQLLLVLPQVRDFYWIMAGTGRDRWEKRLCIKFADGTVRLWEQLSDGYRYLALLVGELCMRSIVMNKHLGITTAEVVTGIVMIDEFGVHLHPELQAVALKRLTSAFPKVQFIISTHSPMMVSGLKKEQVFLLEVDEEGKRSVRHPEQDVIGAGAEWILQRIFGLTTTFDAETVEKTKQLHMLMRKSMVGTLSEAELKKFKELKEKVGAVSFDNSLQDPLYRRFLEALDARSSLAAESANPSDEEITRIVDDLINGLGA